MLAGSFDHYIGIDWTGAKGPRLPGLSVAVARSDIVHLPDQRWRRQGVADWLMGLEGRALIGIDASFGFPFVDEGAFLPGSDIIAPSARTFWQHVDAISGDDPDLHAGSFVRRYAPWFRLPGLGSGHTFQPRLRVCEQAYNAHYPGRSESVFHLIGPSQVGMSSLSVMRILAHLAPHPDVAIWPFDDMAQVANARLVFVELFATQFVRAGGAKGKIRDRESLDAALAYFGHQAQDIGPIDDHQADAAMMAAGLPSFAANPALWQPKGLTTDIAHSEGWTFGVESA